ncbi:MAG TPA: class I SAM-dependent methyltransferase [Polyangia bacterium]|nr:class I SAM-dependent methyltransferase [Polyangia bacterium]
MSGDFFDRMRATLEPRYAGAETPWQQSGFSGPEARWIALRRPVADAIDRSGTFLDVGCANGYLADCVARWTAVRDLAVEPHGIDLSPRLIALAHARLPSRSADFVVANAHTHRPARRYDFVRTELVYVPAADEAAYLAHLLEACVAPGGALLVCNYLEDQPDVAARILPGAHPTTRILERLAALGFPTRDFRDGHDPVKSRKTRVAILRR